MRYDKETFREVPAMIGLGKSISHTKASLGYGWNQEKDAKVVLRQYIVGLDPKEITKEFQMVQAMNKRCKKNTFSFVLSPAITDRDKLGFHKLKYLSQAFLKEMRLEEHQAIGFLHQDKAHLHIHIYVNRIDFNGKAYKDNYIGKKAQRAAEKVALTAGLTTAKQIQEEKNRNSVTTKTSIKLAHDWVMLTKRPTSFEVYIAKMREKDIKVIPSFNSQKELQGFRFQYGNDNFKGSEISRLLSFKNLGNQIEENEQENMNTPKKKKRKGLKAS
ncbi:hypothetical protein MTsPCn9_15970 [Croceitalea sp. MTPC9]|uniref:relaxase/mobilization nuclease domain-containing protein n=1 Tax=unclassified Croceitalea TaxID=2632280 RepID=UPI002B3B3485|nr:hypothetical protein MTsPCn6_08820 [Croceitalea sp. MTPC6]GMN16661.1 hypothetical protein MTsPCn9_15970 [Croceitalea sp. MTPC9]